MANARLPNRPGFALPQSPSCKHPQLTPNVWENLGECVLSKDEPQTFDNKRRIVVAKGGLQLGKIKVWYCCNYQVVIQTLLSMGSTILAETIIRSFLGTIIL